MINKKPPAQNVKLFDDNYTVIVAEVEKRRHKWHLHAVPSIGWEDIRAKILVHIWKKMHLWDPAREIEPWLNTVIHSQLSNELRNTWKHFARPCLDCPMNAGGNLCNYTDSGLQDNSCKVYRKWEFGKKRKYDIRIPVSVENHTSEVDGQASNFINYEEKMEHITAKLKEVLTTAEFKIYDLLFIQHKKEKDAAQILQFKTSDKHKMAGYRRILTVKKKIIAEVRNMIGQIGF